MKIVLYDPLFSKVGHFERYNKYLVELLDQIDVISEILIYAEHSALLEIKNISAKANVILIESDDSFDRNDIPKNLFGYVKGRIKEYSNYRKILSKIESSKADLVFFTSQGNLSFWLAVKGLKLHYMISVISIKWLFFDKGVRYMLKKIFLSFLNKSKLNLFTETLYQKTYFTTETTVPQTLVIPDRYLYDKSFNRDVKIPFRLSTFGTVVWGKSPIAFMDAWKRVSAETLKFFKYDMRGKVKHEDLLVKLKEYTSADVNFSIHNSYLDESDYNKYFNESDFIVIPYPEEYTQHATSGVMWDCFESKKPILCPDIEPFSYYIKKYNVGYAYNLNKLDDVLKLMVEEKDSFNNGLEGRFKQMHDDFSKLKLMNSLKEALNKIC